MSTIWEEDYSLFIKSLDTHAVCFPFLLVRLEEKFSDIETENQVLRQQGLVQTPAKKVSERPPIPSTQVNVFCKLVLVYALSFLVYHLFLF